MLSPSKTCMAKGLSYRLRRVLPMARKTLSVHIVISFAPQDMAEEEHGGRTYFKICSPTSALTQSATLQNNCSAVAESGWHMKPVIAKPGDAPNTPARSTRVALGLKIISDANTLTLFRKLSCPRLSKSERQRQSKCVPGALFAAFLPTPKVWETFTTMSLTILNESLHLHYQSAPVTTRTE
jgi:hypothetical protein